MKNYEKIILTIFICGLLFLSTSGCKNKNSVSNKFNEDQSKPAKDSDSDNCNSSDAAFDKLEDSGEIYHALPPYIFFRKVIDSERTDRSIKDLGDYYSISIYGKYTGYTDRYNTEIKTLYYTLNFQVNKKDCNIKYINKDTSLK